MGKKFLAALMGCAVALCVGLVGCGGGASSSDDLPGVWDVQNTSEFVGVAMGSAGVDLPEAVLAEMGELIPQICFLNLNADGTFQLVLATDEIIGDWTSDGSSVTLTVNGEALTGSLAGGNLTLDVEGINLVFVKTGDAPREVPTEDELQSLVMEMAMRMIGAAA